MVSARTQNPHPHNYPLRNRGPFERTARRSVSLSRADDFDLRSSGFSFNPREPARAGEGGSEATSEDIANRMGRMSLVEDGGPQAPPGAFPEGNEPEENHTRDNTRLDWLDVADLASTTISSVGVPRRETTPEISDHSDHVGLHTSDLAESDESRRHNQPGNASIGQESIAIMQPTSIPSRVTFQHGGAESIWEYTPASSRGVEVTGSTPKNPLKGKERASSPVVDPERRSESSINERLRELEERDLQRALFESRKEPAVGETSKTPVSDDAGILVSAHVGSTRVKRSSLKEEHSPNVFKIATKGSKRKSAVTADPHTPKRGDNLMPGTSILRERTPGTRPITSNLQSESEARKPTSQLVGTGYLSKVLGDGGGGGGPPDEPSDGDKESSDGNSEDEGSDLNDRDIMKMMKLVLRKGNSSGDNQRVKADPPEKWDGDGEDYTRYEHFMFDVDHYFEATRYPVKLRVKQMGQYLEGAAKSWFITVVAPRASEYTVRQLGEELFDQFFPPYLRSQFREAFNTAEQGNLPFKQFVQHVKNLASRVPDISERQIIIRVWFGAHRFFRAEWSRAGFDPEVSSLENIMISGERFEISILNARIEKAQHSQQLKGKKADITHLSSKAISPSRTNKIRPKAKKPQPKQGKPKYRQPHSSNAPKLKDISKTKEQINNLRAEGKCFLCEQTGHIARDCRSKKTAKPPGIESNNIDVRFEELSDEIPSLSCNAFVLDLNENMFDNDQFDVAIAFEEGEGIFEARRRRRRLRTLGQPTRSWSVPEGEDLLDVQRDIHERTQPLLRRFRFNRLGEPPPIDLSDNGRIVEMALRWEATRILVGRERLEQAERDELGFAAAVAQVESPIREDNLDADSDDESVYQDAESREGSLSPERQQEIRNVIEVIMSGESEAEIPPPTGPANEPTNADQIDVVHDLVPEEGPDPAEIHVDQALEMVLHNDPNKQTCKQMYYKYISTIKGIVAPEISVLMNAEQDLRFYFKSHTDMDERMYLLVDLLTGIDDLVIASNEIEDLEIDFDLKSHILHDEHWSEIVYADHIERLQVAEMIQDSFALMDDNPIFESADAGITRRDRFRVKLIGRRNGFYVFDRLRFPSMWRIRNRDLYNGRWDATSIIEDQGETRFELLGTPATYEEIDYLARILVSQVRRQKVKEAIELLEVAKISPQSEIVSETYRYKQLARTASKPKDFERKVPRALIVNVEVEGNILRALLDSGSLADFISTTAADQLSLKLERLAKPIPCAMAAQGSRTSIQYSTTVDFKFQEINEQRRFDIMNLESWDMILGTPFIFQHSIMMGLNPPRIFVGSKVARKMVGDGVSSLTSLVTDVLKGEIDSIREKLKEEVKDLCKSAEETPLPPMRAVNHHIPLIDENKVYKWRASRCPEALSGFWKEKRDKYLKSGRWKFQSGRNAAPMLIIPKKDGPNGEKRWRTVVDKREINANTRKLTSPLPNMETILSNVLRHKFRSLIDGKDAYEQIRVIPEDVHKTLFNTPDGTMESLVLQQGDCNGGATYQALMNHIFGSYIGVFIDVYLDDIIIYSDTVEGHVQHIRLVFEILRKEELYLTSADKLQFFAKRLVILGHVIDEDGLVMDPHKVDSIMKWKVPTSRELLASFLGAVGFLAPDCKGIRVPMAVLTPLAGSKAIWRWGPTEQRSFEEVKRIVHTWRDHHRKPLDYSENAQPINLVCDASLTGAGGVVSQGENVNQARIVAFWSAKFSSAQQNYPVHDRELLAIVESLKRFKHLLLGTRFRIWTDHKPLKFLGSQANLSARQHRWIDVLADFDFSLDYLPGESNLMADSLSRMYSNEPKGIIRAESEMITEKDAPERGLRITSPLYTGGEVVSAAITGKVEIPASDINRMTTRSRSGKLPNIRPRSDSQHAAVLPLTKATRAEVTRQKKIGRHVQSGGRIRQRTEHEEKGDSTAVMEDNETLVTIPENEGFNHTELDDEQNASQSAPNGTGSETENSGLVEVLSKGEPLVNFPECLKSLYKSDSLMKSIIEAPGNYRNFSEEGDILILNENGRRRLCIPDGTIKGHNVREFVISQAHSLLAHMGNRKTLNYICETMWWPSMTRDVRHFCESCQLCITSKTSTQKPMGLLKTLEVPDRPWQVIGFDFVGPLPTSKNRHGEFDRIAVFVDHLTAMTHLVPARTTYNVKDVAELVFDSIYKLHGLPDTIVSDRDTLFTSEFWKELNHLIGVQLRMSSSYHPESDGTTERMNRTVGQMLRQCVNQDQNDWSVKLPYIEFAINSAKSEITGHSPFFLNTGRSMKPMVFDLEGSPYKGISDFAARVKEALIEAHDSILTHRVKQVILANRKRRPASFQEDDLVYLSTENMSLPKGRSRKLSPKYIGPFKIEKVIVPNTTFRLELPSDLKSRGIHNVFHTKLLRPHIPNDDRRFPGRSIRQTFGVGEAEREWLVSKIISHKGYGINSVFEVEWQAGDRAWMDYQSIRHLTALDDYLKLQGASRIGELKRVGESVDSEVLSANATTIRWGQDTYIRDSAKVYRTQHYNAIQPSSSSKTTMSILYKRTDHNQQIVAVPGASATECTLTSNELYLMSRGEGPGPRNIPKMYDLWAQANGGYNINKILELGFKGDHERYIKEEMEKLGLTSDAISTGYPIGIPPPFPTKPNWGDSRVQQQLITSIHGQNPNLVHSFHQLPRPLGTSRPRYEPKGKAKMNKSFANKPPQNDPARKHAAKKAAKAAILEAMQIDKDAGPTPVENAAEGSSKSKNKKWIRKQLKKEKAKVQEGGSSSKAQDVPASSAESNVVTVKDTTEDTTATTAKPKENSATGAMEASIAPNTTAPNEAIDTEMADI